MQEQQFPVPVNEELRLIALEDLQILDTPEDERFDRIARLAQAHFNVPVVRITFIDKDRSWFKSVIGMEARQAPRKIAICSHAIMSDDVLVSKDLAVDPLFAKSPMVAGKPHFRFYAGAPIVLTDGFRVGSICLMDYGPHPDFDENDTNFLKDLANIVVNQLDLHKRLTDQDRELGKTRETLEIAKSAKNRFLAIVNHEFNTPLNAISGFAQILSGRQTGAADDEKFQGYANYILNGAFRLAGLVDRILAYSSAETGELRLRETEFDFSDFMENVASAARTAASLKDINVLVRLPDDAPAALYADEVQMNEAMMQITENAISASKQGGRVEIAANRQADKSLILSVIDWGDGIEREKLDIALNAFGIIDDSYSRSNEGIGLGLPLSKLLLELHGGAIQIESEREKGTCVNLALPANRCRD